jgi:hypothetical protein
MSRTLHFLNLCHGLPLFRLPVPFSSATLQLFLVLRAKKEWRLVDKGG